MTLMFQQMEKCSVCGHESKRTAIGSLTILGAPDLDYRPSETQRSTMRMWSHACPNCGYIATRLDASTVVTEEWLASEAFQNANNIPFENFLARKSYKQYLINMEDKNIENAFESALWAAWACDDVKDTDNALLCRKLALALVDELIEKADDSKRFVLQKLDLLRRTNQFGRVLQEFGGLDMQDEFARAVLTFQIEKCKQHDNACYTFADVREE